MECGVRQAHLLLPAPQGGAEAAVVPVQLQDVLLVALHLLGGQGGAVGEAQLSLHLLQHLQQAAEVRRGQKPSKHTHT